LEDGLTANGVTTLHGHARFTGAQRIDTEGGSYDADRFLVATGARPRRLEFPGHEHLIDRHQLPGSRQPAFSDLVRRWPPVAVSEAKVAASNMLKGTTTTPDYAGIPSAVFTIPELARVGKLESEAHAAGIDLTVRYSDTNGWYSN